MVTSTEIFLTKFDLKIKSIPIFYHSKHTLNFKLTFDQNYVYKIKFIQNQVYKLKTNHAFSVKHHFYIVNVNILYN